MNQIDYEPRGKPVVFDASPYDELCKRFRPAQNGGRETSVYLVGEIFDTHLRVTRVLAPGRPHESAAMTHADYEAAAPELTKWTRLGYSIIGEAHLHLGIIGPSGGDLATLARIHATHPGYLCVVQARFQSGKTPVITATSLDTDGSRIDHRVLVGIEEAPQLYQVFIPAQKSDIAILDVGLGSGGVLTAIQVGKLRVREVTYVDSDTFEERNLDRHLADPDAVGKPKARWLAKFVRSRAGATRIRSAVLEITPATEKIWRPLLQRADLIVQATGHPGVAMLLSQAARELGKPIIHAGSYEGGKGGFVFTQGPRSTDPCYSCVSGIEPTVADDAKTLADLERAYGLTPEQLHRQVGLWTDISVTAALHSKAVVEYLKHGDDPARPNFIAIDNARISVRSERVSQRQTCACCFPPETGTSTDEALRALAAITEKEA